VLDGFERLAGLADTDPAIATALRGFAGLLQRVGDSYSQQDRDISLRSRSLELSSAELSEANQRLQAELGKREQAIARLQDTIRLLRKETGQPSGAQPEDDLEGLINVVSALVAYRQHGQQAIRQASRHWKTRSLRWTSTPSSALPTATATSAMPTTNSVRSAATAGKN
jgi:hypothetical protein